MIQIKNQITEQDASIEESDLRELEDKYDFKFLDVIRQFYLQYNGGRLERHYYVTQDNTYILSYFFSIKYGLATLNDKMELNYADEWWSKELIPFGYDGGGNSFCFHKTSGKIYYVYEDTYDDDDGNVPIECLASDFLSFINNMVAEE